MPGDPWQYVPDAAVALTFVRDIVMASAGLVYDVAPQTVPIQEYLTVRL